MDNPIQWVEIATEDIERAKIFYQTVFGYTFEYLEMPDSKMYMFGSPEKAGSAGCLVQSAMNQPSKDGSLIYLSSEDLAVPLARVESAGGEISVPKTDIGDFGFFAHIIDTEGNRIGLHSNQ